MRDPKRIKRVLKLIEKFWDKVPDWRLGQLLVNVSKHNDPFYYEDDELEKELKRIMKEETWWKSQ